MVKLDFELSVTTFISDPRETYEKHHFEVGGTQLTQAHPQKCVATQECRTPSGGALSPFVSRMR